MLRRAQRPPAVPCLRSGRCEPRGRRRRRGAKRVRTVAHVQPGQLLGRDPLSASRGPLHHPGRADCGRRTCRRSRGCPFASGLCSKLHTTPERFLRTDDTSRLRGKGHEVSTTATLLEAEARLLDAGRRTSGPAGTTATIAAVTEKNLVGRGYWLPASRRAGSRPNVHRLPSRSRTRPRNGCTPVLSSDRRYGFKGPPAPRS